MAKLKYKNPDSGTWDELKVDPLAAWPVGSIYLSLDWSTSPAAMLGNSTWERITDSNPDGIGALFTLYNLNYSSIELGLSGNISFKDHTHGLLNAFGYYAQSGTNNGAEYIKTIRNLPDNLKWDASEGLTNAGNYHDYGDYSTTVAGIQKGLALGGNTSKLEQGPNSFSGFYVVAWKRVA